MTGQQTVDLVEVPRVLAALDRLYSEVRKATSFAELDDIADKAAGLQRRYRSVKNVSDRAGEIWTEAETRLGVELNQLPVAKGTRGTLAGRKKGSTGRKKGASKEQLSGGAILEPPDKSDVPTLTDLKIARKRAARAKRLAAMSEEERERLAAKLKAEEKAVTPDAILSKQRQEQKQEKKHELATAAFSADGPFDVAVIDPPWAMEKIDRDVRPNQAAFDYPTMSEDEIEKLLRDDLLPRLKSDVHGFMWTTQRWLPAALRLMEKLGFRYVFLMVWHKPGGFQPIDLPQYNAEFVVYGRRGSPLFVDTKDFKVCFNAPRHEHSRKPAEFYATIARVTGGSRIDVFAREQHEGFAQFGNQIEHFKEAAQ